MLPEIERPGIETRDKADVSEKEKHRTKKPLQPLNIGELVFIQEETGRDKGS